MKGYKIFFSIYFIFLSSICLAQENYVDSLKLLVSKSKDDTFKVNTLLQLSKAYISSFPESAMSLSKEALHLSEKLHYLPGKAFALKNIGMVFYNQSRYVETIDNWSQSYRLFDSINDKANEALLLNNLGSVYMNQGNDSKALENYFQSLQIAEKKGDKHTTAIAMGNIGTIYSNNDFTQDKALNYYLKALDISEELRDNNIMGGLLVNIGETYLKRNKDDSALHYFKKSLQAYENTENVPYSLNDIGKAYTKKRNFSLAKEKFLFFV